jgi:hypothetical protein
MLQFERSSSAKHCHDLLENNFWLVVSEIDV